MRRWTIRILGTLALAILIALIALRTPDMPSDELRDRYANAESEFVTVAPGLTVHLRDEGPADAPVLVLLHGSNASLHTWEPWVERLKDRYRIIRLDQPGHGLTGPHPQDCYSAACYVEALDATMRARGIEHFVLAGNSMGGWIAWNYALAHADKLDGLILVDAGGLTLPKGVEPKLPIGFRIASVPVLNKLGEIVTPRSMIEKSLRQSISVQEVITPAMIDRYWELLRYPGNRHATMLRFADPRITATDAQLKSIATPTLILWGREDRLIPVVGARILERDIPNSRAVIYDGIGHIPMEETPDRSAADVATFMTSLQAAR